MWSEPKLELREHEVTMAHSSDGSEVVMMNDQIVEAAARSQPTVANLNVTKSSRVHIGPKFVSVTQNVENTEVVKGRILGLELVSPQNSKRLRCSIAVFVCWAFVVATALTFFIVHYALAKQEIRLDIDLPFYRYVWDVAKSTTKAERLSCAAAMLVLLVCLIVISYFIAQAKKPDELSDVAPHEWFITREMWLAPEFDTTERTDEYDPLRLVVIAHSVSPECNRFANCAAELRNLQSYFTKTMNYDLPYNFLIGNDGRVYEGRGWNVVGAHIVGYNRCTMALAFIGDYREGLPSYSKVTDLQLERAHMLLEQGVKLGYLHPHFQVLGARDLDATHSPGTNIYNKIRQWSNYAHNNLFKDRSCPEIKALFENENNTSVIATKNVD